MPAPFTPALGRDLYSFVWVLWAAATSLTFAGFGWTYGGGVALLGAAALLVWGVRLKPQLAAGPDANAARRRLRISPIEAAGSKASQSGKPTKCQT